MNKLIGAAEFKSMLLSAAANLENNKIKLNELNVFPVPDGDTGTNMVLTIKSAVNELNKGNFSEISKIADVTAAALLRGARGNSGVILSLLFRGISKSLVNVHSADGKVFAEALRSGSDAAYKAVVKPAEGTILTVSRVAAEGAFEFAAGEPCPIKMLEKALELAKDALAKTTEQNPTLKKAGVVDAGAYGWVFVMEGFLAALSGNPFEFSTEAAQQVSAGSPMDVFNTEDILFAYCTEFIVMWDNKKLNPLNLRAKLETIGDSVVVVDDADIIKVHVHTNEPNNALGEGLKYGALTNIKIENMKEQHGALVDDTPVPAEKVYGFVAVSIGPGIDDLFHDLGVDMLVSGGQTMNSSTEDILRAINKTPSEIVFVLPNNKNIIMSAEQTADLTDKKVVVLPTTSIPQGFSALLAFNPDLSIDENRDAMMKAASGVTVGQITYAARNSDFDGRAIKKGEYLGISAGKLSSSNKDIHKVAKVMAKSMGLSGKTFISIYYGEGISHESAEKIADIFRAAADEDTEIMVISGGQPVYYYIISAE